MILQLKVNFLKIEYRFTPEGKEFVSTIPPPIAIVSVAGLYRTGKSYLLNRMLLSRNSGFGTGHTVNACTKGLWVWQRPVPGTTKTGEKINCLIVDSEGIGSWDETNNHDNSK